MSLTCQVTSGGPSHSTSTATGARLFPELRGHQVNSAPPTGGPEVQQLLQAGLGRASSVIHIFFFLHYFSLGNLEMCFSYKLHIPDRRGNGGREHSAGSQSSVALLVTDFCPDIVVKVTSSNQQPLLQTTATDTRPAAAEFSTPSTGEPAGCSPAPSEHGGDDRSSSVPSVGSDTKKHSLCLLLLVTFTSKDG